MKTTWNGRLALFPALNHQIKKKTGTWYGRPFLKSWVPFATGPPPPIIGHWIFGVKLQDLTPETSRSHSFRERFWKLLGYPFRGCAKISLEAKCVESHMCEILQITLWVSYFLIYIETNLFDLSQKLRKSPKFVFQSFFTGVLRRLTITKRYDLRVQQNLHFRLGQAGWIPGFGWHLI